MKLPVSGSLRKILEFRIAYWGRIQRSPCFRRVMRKQLPVHGDGPWMKYAEFVEAEIGVQASQ
jgi:hypothetical protein